MHNVNNRFIRNNILTLCAFLLSFYTIAQPSSNYPYKPDKQYFKSYLEASKKVITGPARWDKNEWIMAGSTVALGTICYIYDNEIRDFFQNNNSKEADFASEYVFSPWGGISYPAIFLGGYYLYGIAANNNKSRQIALAGTQAFVMSTVSTQILKHVFHRHRPDDDLIPNPHNWDGPLDGWEYTSFPSRHATIAFSLATVIADSYNDKTWVSIISYSIASGVAISRVYSDEHWASDVIVGSALGFAIGKSVSKIMKNETNFTMGITSYGGISVAYNIK